MPAANDIDTILSRARELAWRGDGEAAKHAFVEALRRDPTHFEALNDLAALACASGHLSAARVAYRQAARHHPANPIARVNLANLLLDDGEIAEARGHYEAALAADPEFPEAHQGLARALTALGEAGAEAHRERGFRGRAVLRLGYRGVGSAIPVLLLVSARLGNMPARPWLDDRLFDVTAVHVEYADDSEELPPHALLVNAIGDADLCAGALIRAGAFFARSDAPKINCPLLAQATGRVQNARRLGAIPGVAAPKVAVLPRAEIAAADFGFPLLLRSPGFHTGLHFVRAPDRASLPAALEALPGDDVMAIEYLDARGPDGLARKYRVMFIDGAIYPLHLAISRDWKVHYFTAAMADDPAHREEERRFLEDMRGAIGPGASAALELIGAKVGLDYFGIDFGLASDGSLLLFEANAAMVIIPPPPDAIWDYRRGPIAAVLDAAKRMALTRALRGRHGAGKRA